MAIDIASIKEQIQTILQDANTTTASPDLSGGLTARVRGVFKVHPLKIPIQASLYPCVCMFVDQKTIEPYTIAKDQLTAKRESTVDIKIVGMISDTRMSTPDFDASDEEINLLMENVEQVLRGYSTLNSTVTWAFPSDTTYHDSPLERNTFFRVGIMNLEAKVYY